MNEGKLAAYLALCNDAIRLEFEERDNMELSYTTVPAVKVARLAVSVDFQGKGIGKEALQFAVYYKPPARCARTDTGILPLRGLRPAQANDQSTVGFVVRYN